MPEIVRNCPHSLLEIAIFIISIDLNMESAVEVAGFLAPLGRFVPSTASKEVGPQRIPLVG